MAKKVTVKCHVCESELTRKETEPAPTICHVCGTNLASPDEKQRCLVKCDYAKSYFGIWPGVMVLSDKRVFWVKSATRGAALGGGLVGVAVASAMNKDAGQTQMNVKLENLDCIGNYRRGFRGGMAIFTKDGREFRFLGGKTKQIRDQLGL